MNIKVDPTGSNAASAMLNSKIRPRAVVGYGIKIFHPSPPNYVTRSPGEGEYKVTKIKAAMKLYSSSDPSMKIVSKFEHSAALGYQFLITEALRYSEEPGLTLWLGYLEPTVCETLISLCRMCGKFDDSVDHIMYGYPELAKTEYAASYIHWKVCQSYDIETTDK